VGLLGARYESLYGSKGWGHSISAVRDTCTRLRNASRCRCLWINVFYAASFGVVTSGRSTSLPFSNRAPARTSATRRGALTARQRDSAAFDELVGHGDSGRRREEGIAPMGYAIGTIVQCRAPSTDRSHWMPPGLFSGESRGGPAGSRCLRRVRSRRRPRGRSEARRGVVSGPVAPPGDV
jgi:hypothetical protein